MKKLILGASFLLGGIAIYKGFTSKKESITSNQMREWLRARFPDNEGGFRTLIDRFNDFEINVIYQVFSNYIHPREAPQALQDQFYLIGAKYNIFT